MNDHTSRPPDSRVKRVAKNLTALGIGCAIVALLGEVTARVLDLPPKPLPPLNAETYRLAENPIIKFEYRPGYAPEAGPYHESMAGFRINSAGFRDREFSVSKPEGVRRIIVLGDSITAGNGIAELDQVYPRRLEALMNEGAPDTRTEVLNMGVGGYNMLQEVETLRVKGIQYRPDIVLVGFCINDFSWRASPFVRLVEQLDTGQRETLRQMQWKNSVWLNTLIGRSRLALFLIAQAQALRPEKERTYDIGDYSIRGNDPVTMAIPMLSDLQQEYGFECYIFLIPGFDNLFSKYAHGEIHQKVFEIAADYPNLKIIDLLSDFAKLTDNPSKYAMDGLHPTKEGHDVLAQLLAHCLASPSVRDSHPPSAVRVLIRNGSFEVKNLENNDPAVWFAAPPGQRYAEVVEMSDAADGDRVLKLQGLNDDWTVFSQRIQLEPGEFNRPLVLTAFGKAPVAQNMFLTIEWRIGSELFSVREPWPASDTWTRAETRAIIPSESEGHLVRAIIFTRPGSEYTYYVDRIEAHLE